MTQVLSERGPQKEGTAAEAARGSFPQEVGIGVSFEEQQEFRETGPSGGPRGKRWLIHPSREPYLCSLRNLGCFR